MMKKTPCYVLMLCLTIGVCGCDKNPLTQNETSGPTSQPNQPAQPEMNPGDNPGDPTAAVDPAQDPASGTPGTTPAPAGAGKVLGTPTEASASAIDFTTAFLKVIKVGGRYAFELKEPIHFEDESGSTPVASKWLFEGTMTISSRARGKTNHSLNGAVYLDPKDNLWKVLTIAVDDGAGAPIYVYDALAADAEPLVRDDSSRKASKDDGPDVAKKAKKDEVPLTAEEQAAKNEKAAAGKLNLAKQFLESGKTDVAKKRFQEIVTKYPGTAAAESAATLLGNL